MAPTSAAPLIRTSLLAAMVGAAFASSALAGPAETIDGLRKGGYTLFFRHAQTDWRVPPGAQPLLAAAAACAGERQLSEEGRDDARALGVAVKSLNLTISEIAAAGLCRMQETAKIAFGAPRTVQDLAPRPGMALSLSAQAAAVERLARAPLPEHGIRIIVGDYEVAQALYGVTLAEGDAVVLRTGADGKAEVVARLRLSDWRALSPVAAKRAPGGA